MNHPEQPEERELSERIKHLATRHRTATLVAFALATSAEYWTSSGISLVLTDLTGTLSASSDEASWALTLYTTAFAVSITLSHRLSGYFGNRIVLTSCALLYTLSSVGCALSSSLMAFLIFRVFQGFSGGVFLVRAFVFLTHQFDPTARGKALLEYGLTFFIIGKCIAPAACGWMTDAGSWRLLFLVSAVLMLPAALLFYIHTSWSWLKSDKSQRLDWLGITLLLIGASSLQAVLSRGEVDGWLGSQIIRALLALGLTSNVFFIIWQLSSTNEQPLLDLKLFKDRSCYSGATLGFALGLLLSGSLFVVPQYLRTIEIHSALQTGLLLSIGGAGSVIVLCNFNAVSALVMRFGPKSVISLALVLEMSAELLFGHYTTTNTPDHFLWLPLLLNGSFVALSVPTLGTAAFAKLNESQISNGRAIFYGSRQFGASIGVTLATILIDHRMTLHSERLFDTLFNRNLAWIGAMNVSDEASAHSLASLVQQQSAVLTYVDVFYVMALIAGGALLLIPLLPSISLPTSDKAGIQNSAFDEPERGCL